MSVRILTGTAYTIKESKPAEINEDRTKAQIIKRIFLNTKPAFRKKNLFPYKRFNVLPKL